MPLRLVNRNIVLGYRRSFRKGGLTGIRGVSSAVMPTSYSFSGCGWLSPYYFGVLETLRQNDCLTEKTMYAGTSGGALAALVGFTGIDTRVALETMVDLSLDDNVHRNVDSVLRREVMKLLMTKYPTENEKQMFLEKVNDKTERLNLCVTRVWPEPSIKPMIVSQFSSVDDLVDVTAASCFIPIWSKLANVGVTTLISGRSSQSESTKLLEETLTVVDGGFTAFMPPIGNCRVSPFPEKYILRSMRKPHICLDPGTLSLPRLVYWVLNPASPAQLRDLYDMGMQSTETYLERKARAQQSERVVV
jgi:hypothetical protein